MNFEFFIAKRIISAKSYKSSVSAPIIKIGIAAIVISIVVMLIAVAVSVGLQQKIRDKAVAFNGHITISNFDTNISEGAQIPISKNQEFYPEFSSVAGIDYVQAVAHKFGIIRTETDFEALFVKGVGEDYNWRYFDDFLISGRLPLYSKAYSQEVIISEYLSRRLNLIIGQTFQMYFLKSDTSRPPRIVKFEIVGVFNSGFEELDQSFLIGDIKHVQRLNRWTKDQVGQFEVFIEDYSALDQKGEEVYTQTPSSLNAETIKQKYALIFEWISIFDKNTYGIIGMMILVGVINMITALLVLILERTQMIGVLKALGSTNWRIQKVFIYTASYLAISGLIIGNFIGLTLLFIQKYFSPITLDPSIYYVTKAPVYIDWTYILGLNLMTFLVCFLVLIIPSYLIAKINPVQAIKFD
ncbi:MAG: FtsX-like permease family protein [Bacteroidetes bacterium]|nr:FtsX-like permease family protein [Bacteroidota bacterium]MDA1176494.1 FtsX-like permease family protein [Bacteroidota bacterium]